jgi:hypothetical protein
MATLDPILVLTLATGVLYVALNSLVFGLTIQVGQFIARFFGPGSLLSGYWSSITWC